MPRGRPKKDKVDRTNTIPSSPEDRKKLMGYIRDAMDVRTMIAAQKDSLKDIRTACLDEFPITGKLFNSILNFEWNNNFDRVEGEQNEIFTAYENLKNATTTKVGE